MLAHRLAHLRLFVLSCLYFIFYPFNCNNRFYCHDYIFWICGTDGNKKTKIKTLSNDVLDFISQSEQHVLNYINNFNRPHLLHPNPLQCRGEFGQKDI